MEMNARNVNSMKFLSNAISLVIYCLEIIQTSPMCSWIGNSPGAAGAGKKNHSLLGLCRCRGWRLLTSTPNMVWLFTIESAVLIDGVVVDWQIFPTALSVCLSMIISSGFPSWIQPAYNVGTGNNFCLLAAWLYLSLSCPKLNFLIGTFVECRISNPGLESNPELAKGTHNLTWFSGSNEVVRKLKEPRRSAWM